MVESTQTNGETVKQSKHRGTIMSCIALSIVWTMLTSMFMPNMPFILRSYKEHVWPDGADLFLAG